MAGEKQKESIHPTFDKSIQIDFQGAKITSDTGFLLMREVDGRFRLLERAASQIEDPRSPRHTDHSLLQLLRQRVYQVTAGYEDGNDADHLKVDPALRLALGREHDRGAGQSALSCLENNILATSEGLKALEDVLSRSADTLLGAETNGDSSSMSIPLKTPSTESKSAQPLTVTLNGSAIILCFASPAKETFGCKAKTMKRAFRRWRPGPYLSSC